MMFQASLQGLDLSGVMATEEPVPPELSPEQETAVLDRLHQRKMEKRKAAQIRNGDIDG